MLVECPHQITALCLVVIAHRAATRHIAAITNHAFSHHKVAVKKKPTPKLLQAECSIFVSGIAHYIEMAQGKMLHIVWKLGSLAREGIHLSLILH